MSVSTPTEYCACGHRKLAHAMRLDYAGRNPETAAPVRTYHGGKCSAKGCKCRKFMLKPVRRAVAEMLGAGL